MLQTLLIENPLWEKFLGENEELCRSYKVVVVVVVFSCMGYSRLFCLFQG